MSTLDIRVPAEQEGTRSQVLRWLKQPGDAVRENEPLVELETDKVTVEVPAPGDGILREVLKGEREELEPGDVLGRIEIGAGAAAESAGAAVGAPVIQTNVAASLGASRAGEVTGSVSAHQLSPAVRRLLAERGLEPSALQGTGVGGRITVEDVLLYAGSRDVVATGTSVTDASSARAVGDADSARGHLQPHSPMRQRVAEHMVHSLLRTAPHVTSVFEADLGHVIAHRQRHREDFERRGVPLSFTVYFVQAVVAALRAVPEANSRWMANALEVFDRMDIGIATALDGGGLVVPVLRGVESLDLFGIASGLNDLVTRAREGRLQPADLRDGTFTISNHGVSGSLLATPIVINQPQSAILGVGKLEKRAVVLDDDSIVARPLCYVTLTIDHRVMDGQQANRFLQTFVDALQSDPT